MNGKARIVQKDYHPFVVVFDCMAPQHHHLTMCSASCFATKNSIRLLNSAIMFSFIGAATLGWRFGAKLRDETAEMGRSRNSRWVGGLCAVSLRLLCVRGGRVKQEHTNLEQPL